MYSSSLPSGSKRADDETFVFGSFRLIAAFDIAEMARLSLGRSWTGLSDAQRQQMTESYGRYVSAIYVTASTAMPGRSWR
jgi:ABC-type transporter MlaC component